MPASILRCLLTLAEKLSGQVGYKLGDAAASAFAATFDVADDLLWQARPAGWRVAARSLSDVRDKSAHWSNWRSRLGRRRGLSLVHGHPPFFKQVLQGMAAARSAAVARAISRVCFRWFETNPTRDDSRWQQWASHAENAAVASGLARGLVSGLMGALVSCRKTSISTVADQKRASWHTRRLTEHSNWLLRTRELAPWRACGKIPNIPTQQFR